MQFLVKLLTGVFDIGPWCVCRAKRLCLALWMPQTWGLFTVQLSPPVTGDLGQPSAIASLPGQPSALTRLPFRCHFPSGAGWLRLSSSLLITTAQLEALNANL